MKVYRLCNKDEIESILANRNFKGIGHVSQNNSTKNTHQYLQNVNYMHFFDKERSLLYLHPSRGQMICVYDIPDGILGCYMGIGLYLDFINLKTMHKVVEYAIESDKLKFEYLETIYIVNQDLDFDYIPKMDELYDGLSTVYDFQSFKSKIEECLTGTNAQELISENIEFLLTLLPEIKAMMGFEHKHPHHHLDVWEHTLEVLKNLNTKDLQLNMAALLHDIGKPFSYQDEEIRHFHGHPEASYKISQQILTRLRYDEDFIKGVLYLVITHDTPIEPNNLDNTWDMIYKRLQYADAKAHHPDKIEKRLKLLNDIKERLDNIVNTNM